jgi:hypothetical protein
MTDTATVEHPRRASARSAAPGTTWFGAMVALWSVFLTLLVVSPETLEDAYAWLRGLALVWEVLAWILLLPWALAYVVWETSWEQWARSAVLVLIASVHLCVSAPRRRAGV